MYGRFFKPLLDAAGALMLLVLLSPLLLAAMLAVYVSLGRPVFFTQVRPGFREKPFTIFKLRTMDNGRDANGALLPDEERLHGAGRLIRSLSLDELPQLWNIVRGEMSFVGPRPLLLDYLPLYDALQRRRHEVTPGITGWAQVNGRNAISWQQKFAYDVWYVDHRSFALDVKILALTVLRVFRREGISAGNHATMERFRGNDAD